VLASDWYLGVFAATAFALFVLAWILRARTQAFRRIATAQLLLLLLCSAFVTMAVVSSVLPQFKLCGAV
jgi:bacteriorhodopsin